MKRPTGVNVAGKKDSSASAIPRAVCVLGVLTLLISSGGAVPGQAPPDILWLTNAHLPGVGGEGVLSVAFNPGGSLLASGGGPSDRTVKVWRVPDGGLVKMMTNTVDRVDSVVFSPDGQLLAANGGQRGQFLGFRDYTLINFWDTAQWGWRGITNVAYSPAVQVAFSRDGRYLGAACGYWYGDLAIFQMPEGVLLNRYDQFITGYSSLAFSPDDRELASSYFGAGGTQIRNATNGAVRLELPMGSVSVAFSPDGRTLMMAETKEGTPGPGSASIYLADVATGTIRTNLLHPGTVYTAAFTPDGKAIVSWAGDNKIRFWSLRNYSVFQVYDQETTGVWALAVSPNGRYFAYGRDDGVVVLAWMPLWITDIARTDNQVRLTWSGGSGLYQVQRTTDLAIGIWENVGDPTTETTATVSATHGYEFFRVQSLPSP